MEAKVLIRWTLALLLVVLCPTAARAELENVPFGGTLYGNFTTLSQTGVATLGGTPALSVYKNASTSQSTAGVTLVADFDGITGYNNFTVDTSADATFYSRGARFAVVITTGTVSGQSRVGYVVAEFCIECGAVASVTGAVGSVTGNVGGNVTGSVGSVAADGITASSIAPDAIGASELAANAFGASELASDAVTEIQSGLSIPTVGQIADAVWDEPTPHNTAGTMGNLLTSAGAAGDPWATACGGYSDGTFGAFLCSLEQATISPVSPVLDGGTLELVAGDAYDSDRGRQLDDWALTGQPSLSGATVKLVIDGVLEVTATSVQNAGSATQTPVFELTAAQTALLTKIGTATSTSGPYRYQIQAVWAADSPSQPAVLARGFVSVIRRAAP